jgi:PAS domain S-box-containing protein
MNLKKSTKPSIANQLTTDMLYRLTNATPALVALYNIHTGKYIFVNDGVKRLLGYKPTDFTKKGLPFVISLVHPDDLPIIMAKNTEALKKANKQKTKKLSNEPIAQFEYRMKHKNGTWRWLHTDGSIFDRNAKGEVEHVLNISLDITERKEREQVKERYSSSLLKNVSDAVIVTDSAYNITSFNSTAEQLYGWKKKEVLGKFAGQVIPTKYLTNINREKLREELETKGYWRGEVLQQTKYGRWLTVLASVSSIRDDDGTIIGAIAVNKDISDRIIIEKRYKRLIELSNIVPWETDYKTEKFTFVGQQSEQMFGYKPEEWYAANFWRHHIHPDDKKATLEYCLAAKKVKSEYEAEYRMMKKDGQFIWIKDIVNVIEKEDGEKILSGFFVDITERKKNEQDLEYKKSLLEAQQEVAPEGILIVSPEGKIVTANHRFITMWDFPQTIISRTDHEALQLAEKKLIDSKGFRKKVEELYAKRMPNHEVLRLKNGKIFDRYGAPIIGDEGTYFGYVWFFLDITEREHLAKQKDAFIGVATHELKTPVTSVKAYTQILKKRFKNAGNNESVELLQKMDLQLNKLINLIGDLLDVTKIEAGKLSFSVEKFEIAELVQEITEELQRTTERHVITVKSNIKRKINADRDRTGQVLTNFLTNAIKYSPNAQNIHVTIKENKEYITVCVQDFGVGIPQDKLSKVFERFYRVVGPKEDTYPGLGLGLYISSEIIKRQGGKIWVESEKGKGSTFCFSLPAGRHNLPLKIK